MPAIVAMPCHHTTPCHPATTHGLPYPLWNTDHIMANACNAIANCWLPCHCKLLTAMLLQTADCHAMPTIYCHATSHLPYTPCQPCRKPLYAMPMLTSANWCPLPFAAGCHSTLPSAGQGEGASKDVWFIFTNSKDLVPTPPCAHVCTLLPTITSIAMPHQKVPLETPTCKGTSVTQFWVPMRSSNSLN